ncbi:hypothetical protein F0919_09225 [Taibaiella lutea]|uniref:Uncharacterized protein n=1 Tax=Taibaiella lutea TaxID=2608001 RepID=A0A5M6CNQ2_9BACT|nr:hypothetical protein [Taibaiella lutea]KAA5534779.1 hypothetical protein F0919_09225 [Taibaiella lutea]
MKIKLFFRLLTISIIWSSCAKDKITNYIAVLYNRTEHSVMILPFKGGAVNSSDSVILNAGDSFLVGEGWMRGEVKTPFFESEYLAVGENDSINVVFDNAYKISHFVTLPSNLPEKYYAFSSGRNIINRDNYEFTRIKDKNDNYTNVHKYFFIEQDYLDAKD